MIPRGIDEGLELWQASAMFTVALGTTCDCKTTLATINEMKLFVTVQVFPEYLKISKKKIPM
jgi:hypothetical protein